MSRLTHWQGEPIAAWEALWGVPAVEAWSSVASTNLRARELVDSGVRPWAVVVAEEQTAGRGRNGRAWASGPGAGVWFTVVVPAVEGAVRVLPLRVGAAVARVVRGLAGAEQVGLKWPNDLWWRDRKLGGILCEAVGEGAVAGIGLNLASPDGEGFDTRPVGLDEIVGARVSSGRLVGEVLAAVRRGIEGASPCLTPREVKNLRGFDVLAGRAVRCEPGPGGIARGVAPDGALRVETGRGERKLYAGTVRPIGPAPRPTGGV